MLPYDVSIINDVFIPLSAIQHETHCSSELEQLYRNKIVSVQKEIESILLYKLGVTGNISVNVSSYYDRTYTISSFAIQIEYDNKFLDSKDIKVKYLIKIPKELYDQNDYNVSIEVRGDFDNFNQSTILNDINYIYNGTIFKPLFFKLYDLNVIFKKYNKRQDRIASKPHCIAKIEEVQLNKLYSFTLTEKYLGGFSHYFNELYHKKSSSFSTREKEYCFTNTCYDTYDSNTYLSNTLYFKVIKILKNYVEIIFPCTDNNQLIRNIVSNISDFKIVQSTKEGVTYKVSKSTLHNSEKVKEAKSPILNLYNISKLNQLISKYTYYVKTYNKQNFNEFYEIDRKRRAIKDGTYTQI